MKNNYNVPTKKNDLVFRCQKCGHLVYICGTPEVKINKIKKLPRFECPNCGEEGFENWIYVKTGNYEKEYVQYEKDC